MPSSPLRPPQLRDDDLAWSYSQSRLEMALTVGFVLSWPVALVLLVVFL